MIDYFALALTHALLVLAVLRIATRPELDREAFDEDGAGEAAAKPAPRRRRGRERKRRRDA